MEWIGLVILVIVVYLFFAMSRSGKNNTAGALKISDYIPHEKDSDGNWCTPEVAVQCVEKFSNDMGAHKKATNLYKSEVTRLIEETITSLQSQLIENNENLASHVKHWESQLSEIDDKDEAQEIKQEIKEMEKAHKKVQSWLNKNIDKAKTDCRKPLKKVLSAAKRAWRSGPDCFHHLEIDYNPPELPDSYYY